MPQFRTPLEQLGSNRGPVSDPLLLVSVRNVAEAVVARNAGVDWIDLKNPDVGPLGRPTLTIAQQVAAELSSNPRTSVALGELADLDYSQAVALAKLFSVVKVGLSRQTSTSPSLADEAESANASFLNSDSDSSDRCGIKSQLAEVPRSQGNQQLNRAPKLPVRCPEPIAWQRADATTECPTTWQAQLGELSRVVAPSILVPVAYADWRQCRAPRPEQIIDYAFASNSRYVLLDTFFKDGRRWSDHCSATELSTWIANARRSGVEFVLAGSVSFADLSVLRQLKPAAIGVRGGVCDHGRDSAISEAKLQRWVAAMRSLENSDVE